MRSACITVAGVPNPIYSARLGEWSAYSFSRMGAINTVLELYFLGTFSEPQLAIMRNGVFYAGVSNECDCAGEQDHGDFCSLNTQSK